jgi:hypothetical protein
VGQCNLQSTGSLIVLQFSLQFILCDWYYLYSVYHHFCLHVMFFILLINNIECKHINPLTGWVMLDLQLFYNSLTHVIMWLEPCHLLKICYYSCWPYCHHHHTSHFFHYPLQITTVLPLAKINITVTPTMSFSLWMWQQTLHYAHALHAQDDVII